MFSAICGAITVVVGYQAAMSLTRGVEAIFGIAGTPRLLFPGLLSLLLAGCELALAWQTGRLARRQSMP